MTARQADAAVARCFHADAIPFNMRVYIHGNLRLVDKLQGMDYAEEQIQWAPEHMEALERLWGVGSPSSSS